MKKRRPQGVKANGQLKRGYRYVRGGRVVKAGCTTHKRGRVCSTRRAKRR